MYILRSLYDRDKHVSINIWQWLISGTPFEFF